MCNILNKIRTAKSSIALIDDFVDDTTIDLLSLKELDVNVKVFSRNRLQANLKNVKRRKCFIGKFDFFELKTIRDRYLLIDEKFLYIMTRNLKYNGKRKFSYVRVIGFDEVERIKSILKICEENAKKYYKQY